MCMEGSVSVYGNEIGQCMGRPWCQLASAAPWDQSHLASSSSPSQKGQAQSSVGLQTPACAHGCSAQGAAAAVQGPSSPGPSAPATQEIAAQHAAVLSLHSAARYNAVQHSLQASAVELLPAEATAVVRRGPRGPQPWQWPTAITPRLHIDKNFYTIDNPPPRPRPPRLEVPVAPPLDPANAAAQVDVQLRHGLQVAGVAAQGGGGGGIVRTPRMCAARASRLRA